MTKLEKKLIIIGITAIITIILAIMGYSFLKGNNPLKKDRYFYVVYNDIEGLSETAPVFLSGKQIGQVKSVKFIRQDTSLVLVTLLIEDNIKIPYGSTAKIVSTDLLGTKAIRLLPNYKSHIWAHTGDTLKPAIEKSIDQLIAEKLTPVEKAVNSLNRLLINLNNTLDPQTIEELRSSISHLRHSLLVMDTTISGQRIQSSINAIHDISQNINNQQDTINHILSRTNQIVTQISDANLKRTIIQLDSMVTAINDILQQIQQGNGSVGKIYTQDELYIKLDSISTKINTLLDEILSNPKHYIKVSVF